ncbi:ATP-binding cassette domain-containing protein, partial [Streptococcus oralis]|uniref:ATP-binding cassette domain-containing protein n=1 Tax=Streptococcus oralis TaxID=1303 RepID=UPI0022846731
MTVIKVEKLSKKIKDKEILRNISFEIHDGECVALIGPNGAGKTTLIDCLLGDKFVSSGQVAIQGFAPIDPRLKQLVSVLPQENEVV